MEKVESKSCLKCGQCCRHVYIRMYMQPNAELDNEWLECHDIKTKRGAAWVTFIIPAPCKYLQGNLCSIHEQKPVSCKEFPNGVPEDMIPDGCVVKEKPNEEASKTA